MVILRLTTVVLLFMLSLGAGVTLYENCLPSGDIFCIGIKKGDKKVITTTNPGKECLAQKDCDVVIRGEKSNTTDALEYTWIMAGVHYNQSLMFMAVTDQKLEGAKDMDQIPEDVVFMKGQSGRDPKVQIRFGRIGHPSDLSDKQMSTTFRHKAAVPAHQEGQNAYDVYSFTSGLKLELANPAARDELVVNTAVTEKIHFTLMYFEIIEGKKHWRIWYQSDEGRRVWEAATDGGEVDVDEFDDERGKKKEGAKKNLLWLWILLGILALLLLILLIWLCCRKKGETEKKKVHAKPNKSTAVESKYSTRSGMDPNPSGTEKSEASVRSKMTDINSKY